MSVYDDPPTKPLTLPRGARRALAAAPAAHRFRRPITAVVALAVAALVCVVGVAWWSVAPGGPDTGQLATVAAPAAEALPASDAPTASADGPAVIDARGRPLSPAAADGARRLFEALKAGDHDAIRALYSPTDAAASWPNVRSRITSTAARTALLEALRRAPAPRPEVAYLYSAGNYGVGLAKTGRVAFFGTGQRASATTAATGTTTTKRSTTSRGMPYSCEDSVVGDGLDAPECDGNTSDATQSTHCSSDTPRCPSGYREGVTNSANPYGCDFDAISAQNPCQWRYERSGTGDLDRPAPQTAAQRWAACHLSGLRQFC